MKILKQEKLLTRLKRGLKYIFKGMSLPKVVEFTIVSDFMLDKQRRFRTFVGYYYIDMGGEIWREKCEIFCSGRKESQHDFVGKIGNLKVFKKQLKELELDFLNSTKDTHET